MSADLGETLVREYVFANTTYAVRVDDSIVSAAACPACDQQIRRLHTSPYRDVQHIAERSSNRQRKRQRVSVPKRMQGTRPIGEYSDIHDGPTCAILTYMVNLGQVAGLCPQCGRSRRNLFRNAGRRPVHGGGVDPIPATPGPRVATTDHPVPLVGSPAAPAFDPIIVHPPPPLDVDDFLLL